MNTVAMGHRISWVRASYPYRRTMLVAETAIAAFGFAGAVQLMAGVFTPPISDLEPLGLTSWMLPGVWLFGTVAVPSVVAAVMLARRARSAPTAVLVASGALLLEVLAQIPFIGPSALQAVFGASAVAVSALAIRARSGWALPPL